MFWLSEKITPLIRMPNTFGRSQEHVRGTLSYKWSHNNKTTRASLNYRFGECETVYSQVTCLALSQRNKITVEPIQYMTSIADPSFQALISLAKLKPWLKVFNSGEWDVKLWVWSFGFWAIKMVGFVLYHVIPIKHHTAGILDERCIIVALLLQVQESIDFES